ncbi:uncharacterized protein LOC142636661 [Castanea sativa]|uniref:uncharacterized protein LOC142636661 n=1 Tax=Castanea sativa TaxID=21020 RepID=UPI003F64B4C5
MGCLVELKIPSKMKVFGWRACHDILPTRLNLTKQRIISENACLICCRSPESTIHALWECAATWDVWAGSVKLLRNGVIHGGRFINLASLNRRVAEYLENYRHAQDQPAAKPVMQTTREAWKTPPESAFKLNFDEAVFSEVNNSGVGAIICNYKGFSKLVIEGANVNVIKPISLPIVNLSLFIDPASLNRQAAEYLKDYKHAQDQPDAKPIMQTSREAWKPPPESAFKLSFDAVVFSEVNRSSVGAIIHHYKGEVMAAMSARGPAVFSSEEGELLAGRKAIEFSIGAGFYKLVIEGDNVNVIKSISSPTANLSLLGNVVDNIKHLIRALQWVSISHTRQSGNKVAHVLAHNARNIVDDMYWIEDSLPSCRTLVSRCLSFMNE